MLPEVLHWVTNRVVRWVWGYQILILSNLKVFIDIPGIDIGVKEEDLRVQKSALDLLLEVVYACLDIVN